MSIKYFGVGLLLLSLPIQPAYCDSMSGVKSALESLAKECQQYALVSAVELTKPLSDSDPKGAKEGKYNQIFLETLNDLSITCLSTAQLKIQQAIVSLKKEQK